MRASASASQVMFTNRKERGELLEGLVVSNKDATVPVLHQVWPPLPLYYYQFITNLYGAGAVSPSPGWSSYIFHEVDGACLYALMAWWSWLSISILA